MKVCVSVGLYQSERNHAAGRFPYLIVLGHKFQRHFTMTNRQKDSNSIFFSTAILKNYVRRSPSSSSDDLIEGIVRLLKWKYIEYIDINIT